jgi:hypothetical protein
VPCRHHAVLGIPYTGSQGLACGHAVAAVPSSALWADAIAFHTGGWNIEPERVAKAKETTTEIPTAHNPGDGRVSPGPGA